MTIGFALIIALQAYCMYHCYKNKKEVYWYFLIFMFSIAGCAVYLLTQVLKKESVAEAQESIGKIINPGAEIQKLKDQLEFSDTHKNRMLLADAYLKSGMYEEAATLYEACRQGMYREDTYLAMQLMETYFNMGQFAEATSLHAYTKGKREFESSAARLALAKSFENLNKQQEAEREFKDMDRSYSNYEQRYEYGLFLQREQRNAEAQDLFAQLQKEFSQLGKSERRAARQWESLVQKAMQA